MVDEDFLGVKCDRCGKAAGGYDERKGWTEGLFRVMHEGKGGPRFSITCPECSRELEKSALGSTRRSRARRSRFLPRCCTEEGAPQNEDVVFGATVLEPSALTPEAEESFRSALDAAGASDLRVEKDEEGRATVFFRLDAGNEREAMKMGSEITLSALKGHGLRWVASGVTYWQSG